MLEKTEHWADPMESVWSRHCQTVKRVTGLKWAIPSKFDNFGINLYSTKIKLKLNLKKTFLAKYWRQHFMGFLLLCVSCMQRNQPPFFRVI